MMRKSLTIAALLAATIATPLLAQSEAGRGPRMEREMRQERRMTPGWQGPRREQDGSNWQRRAEAPAPRVSSPSSLPAPVAQAPAAAPRSWNGGAGQGGTAQAGPGQRWQRPAEARRPDGGQYNAGQAGGRWNRGGTSWVRQAPAAGVRPDSDGISDDRRDGGSRTTWTQNRNGTGQSRNWSGNLDGSRNWRTDRDNNRDRDANRNWSNNNRDRYRDRDGNRNWSQNYAWNNGQAWNGGDKGNWNRDWRRDRRYDWQGYRSSNRGLYRQPYYAPYGWSRGYQRFSIGLTLGNTFYDQQYWLDDPYSYRLPPAYGPYRWVRYFDDVLLVDLRTGQVVDAIYGFFW